MSDAPQNEDKDLTLRDESENLPKAIDASDFGKVLRKLSKHQEVYAAFMIFFNKHLAENHPSHAVIEGENLEPESSPDWVERLRAFSRKEQQIRQEASRNAILLRNADFPQNFSDNFCSQSFKSLRPKEGQTLHLIYFVGKNNNKYLLECLYQDGNLINAMGTSVHGSY